MAPTTTTTSTTPITITLTYDEATLLQYLLPLAAIEAAGLRDVADSLIASLDAQLSPSLAAADPEFSHLVYAMAPLVAAARTLAATLRMNIHSAYGLAIEHMETARAHTQPA